SRSASATPCRSPGWAPRSPPRCSRVSSAGCGGSITAAASGTAACGSTSVPGPSRGAPRGTGAPPPPAGSTAPGAIRCGVPAREVGSRPERRMRRTPVPRCPLLLAQAVRQAAYRFHFPHDRARPLDDEIAGRRDPVEALALTGEQLNPELLFQELELLADARLRGVEAIGGGRDVEAVVDDRQQVFQLL